MSLLLCPLQRRPGVVTRCFVLLGLALVGCLSPSVGPVDLRPPQVTRLSLGPLDATAPPQVNGLAEVAVVFSKPLDGYTVESETVVLVRGTQGEDCAVSGYCLAGRCLGGLCQQSAVDRAWRNDVNSPPLAQSRLATVHPASVALVGQQVTLTPAIPYEPGRLYTLVVSAAVRDEAGNPLISADGRHKGFAYDFCVAPAPAPGPEVSLVAPTAGAADVPPNLREVVVGFDRPVLGATPDGLWLQGGGGRVLAPVAALDSGCPEGLASCFVLRLGEELQTRTRYEITWGSGLQDGAGAEVPLPVLLPFFSTGGAADHEAPQLLSQSIESVEGCLAVWARTDEAARLRAWLQGPGGLLTEAEPSPWGTEHQLLLDSAAGAAGLHLEAWDSFDNLGTWGPLDLAGVGLAPAVLISEVLANPAGPEPAQEFVELVNLSGQAVNLDGWRVTDDAASQGDTLPGASLPAGAVALVVPSGYDERGDADPNPDPGVVILRLDNGTIGSGGLANGGEPVLLYDDSGRLRSSYPGAAADGSAPANGQSVIRILGSGCATRGSWQLRPDGSASPGWLD